MKRWLSALALLVGSSCLTGCPLSDDYYVDPSLEAGAVDSTAHTSTSTSDAGGSSAGGSTTDAGGSTTDAGGGGSGAADGTTDAGGSSSGTGGGSGGSGSGSGGTGGSSANVGGSTATDTGGTGGGTGVTSTTGQTCEVGCNAGRACKAGVCEGGWRAMKPPPREFVKRRYSAVTTFDGKVFIWGGIDADEDPLDDGAIYDPRSDSWSLVAVDSATPSARERAVAVWTGTHVLVVGGLSDSGYERDAALYDPVANQWTATGSASIPRSQGIAGVVDGVVVLLEGFTTDGDAAGNPERYEIDSGTWSRAGDEDDLPYQWSQAIGFTDHEVLVYGGNSNDGRSDAAYSYDVDQDVWTDLPPALSERSGAFGAWDGSKFFVWGGHNDGAYDDGAVFESGAWTALLDGGAPSPRRMPPNWSGWAFAVGPGDFVVIGGVSGSDITLLDSGRYRDGSGWEAIAAYPSGASHAGGAGVWTGEEFVLWGGLGVDDATLAPIGDRWAP
ncbi:MAG TPA: hypothetical protein VI197_29370 [Polyangiaceae bacterium]